MTKQFTWLQKQCKDSETYKSKEESLAGTSQVYNYLLLLHHPEMFKGPIHLKNNTTRATNYAIRAKFAPKGNLNPLDIILMDDVEEWASSHLDTLRRLTRTTLTQRAEANSTSVLYE